MNNALVRPALYYPYVHVRSEHWLKATLLCVPAVTRIVPQEYVPEDLPAIIKYREISGRNGALLQTVPAASDATFDAQHRLLEKIREHEEGILSRYDRRHAPRPDDYWIHIAKFNASLLDYLTQHNLAWHSEHSAAYGHRTWYALHPMLGSAIMTTLGLSIAREEHYDIVTPSARWHETLLAFNENEIFERLLAKDKPTPSISASQARHDLAQYVITMTGINYEALRPEIIPELQESKNFQKFQQLIRVKSPSIDREDDVDAYEEQLKIEAQEIINSWQETKNDISGDLKDALFEQALVLSGEALKAYVTGPDVSSLVIAGGMAVTLVVRKGIRIRQKQKLGNPYQYLTEIEHAQDQFLSMTSPLGLET